MNKTGLNYSKQRLFFTKLDFNCIDSYSYDKEKILHEISHVNIFIGKNNSGKSRFLRKLFSLKDLIPYSVELKEEFEELKSELIDAFSKSAGFNILNPNMNKNDFLTTASTLKYFSPINKELFIQGLQESISCLNQVRSTNARNQANITKKLLIKLQKIENHQYPELKDRMYIPMIRGLRTLHENDIYLKRTVDDYFDDTLNDNIFTGHSIFSDLRKKLLGKPHERKQVQDFQNFLSETFFTGKEVTLIPLEDEVNDVIEVMIGQEEQRPIYDLGDGIQNIILLTFPIFMNSDRQCNFYIEEPDLAMHAGLQRIFLTKLLDFKQHQFFITTHSNHFLNLTFDYEEVSVYRFDKKGSEEKPEFEIKNLSSKDFSILQELGVLNSSVFLSNKTIWVEGISDRLYLRAYMKKYIQELDDNSLKKNYSRLKEDFDYSFVEYQGSNLVHWDFSENELPYDLDMIKSKYLCGDAFLIADGDIIGKKIKGKVEREKVYKEMLGDNFYTFPCKEIENLIPEKILNNYLKCTYPDITSNISYEKYSNSEKGLGHYLNQWYKDKNISSTSGTVNDKINFCKKITHIMNEIEWSLPKEIKTLCKKIFNHIEN